MSPDKENKTKKGILMNRQPNMNTSNLIYLYKIDKNVTIFYFKFET